MNSFSYYPSQFDIKMSLHVSHAAPFSPKHMNKCQYITGNAIYFVRHCFPWIVYPVTVTFSKLTAPALTRFVAAFKGATLR